MSKHPFRRPPVSCHAVIRLASAGLTVLLTAACAVGPTFHRPITDTPAASAQGYTVKPLAQTAGGDSQNFVLGRDVAFAWWQDFGSAKLNALVSQALANSPTLAAAEAALRQAHEQTAAQRGYFFPTVGGDFSPSRQQIAGNLSSNDPGQQGNGTTLAASPPGHLTYTFYTAQLGISYTPDVFGANRRAVESLKAQEESIRYEREAAYITLTTNVVAAALQEAALESQIKAITATIDANRQALSILQDQQRHGLVAAIEVATQETTLAQAEQALPPLDKQLEQTKDLLRALVGALPNDQRDLTFDLDSFTLPRALPLSLPATLLDQRPDVRAAEAQLHSASAQVGQAVAARLPQFTITGAYGGAASSIGQLFATGGPFWNLIGDVAAPIFDGGTLAHRQHAAEAALDQAKAQYRSTVLTAFENVADTLHAIRTDADSYTSAAKAEHAAQTIRNVTRDQYRAGLVPYQALLAAEASYQQTVVTRIEAQTNRFGDVAALTQALGGGWWHRPEVASAN